MLSSPRNENRGNGSLRCRSCRHRYERSTARSRAGCPSLYNAIVDTALPNETRKRIGSLIAAVRSSARAASASQLGAHFGVLALFGELERGLRGAVVAPVRGNHCQGG